MVQDAIAAVNLDAGDETAAIGEMRNAGAALVTLDDALALVAGAVA